MSRKLPLALGGAAAGWALWRAFGPEPTPRFTGDQDIPMRVPGRTVFVGRHEFFVRELGSPDAPPLVLVHGWVYDSLGTWFPVLERLAEHYRVIAVDHRNHGHSARTRGRYTIEQAADEVAAVLDIVAPGPFAVVGYSMGGMIAQALIRRRPGKVDRVVLAATAAFPIPQRRNLARVVYAVGRAIGRFSPWEGIRISWEYMMRTGAIERRHGRWLWDFLADRDVNLYFEGGYAVLRFDARSWVRRLEVPALVIIPTRDQLVPPAAQYELASLLRDVEVVELVGARHEAILTHSDQFLKAVEGFLSRPAAG